MGNIQKRKAGAALLLALGIAAASAGMPAGAQMPEADYPVEAPREFSKKEIGEKLEALAGEYPEFTEIYKNMDDYDDELLEALCNNPEIIGFVKSYPQADDKARGGLTDEELAGGVPLLLQWDERWGYVPYGNAIIAANGCAPTALSMVIVGLTGAKEATPDKLAAEAEAGGYYLNGKGTSWKFMTEGGQKYGVEARELALDEGTVLTQLKEGHPIICSVRKGDFTFAGHFIVLTGEEDGRIRVHDPYCISRSRRLWDYAALAPQIKNLWAYSAAEPEIENGRETETKQNPAHAYKN